MREELDIPMAIQGSQIYPGEHYNNQPSSGVRMSGSHSPGGRPEDEGPRFSWTVALPLRPHLLDRDPTPAPARVLALVGSYPEGAGGP